MTGKRDTSDFLLEISLSLSLSLHPFFVPRMTAFRPYTRPIQTPEVALDAIQSIVPELSTWLTRIGRDKPCDVCPGPRAVSQCPSCADYRMAKREMGLAFRSWVEVSADSPSTVRKLEEQELLWNAMLTMARAGHDVHVLK